MRTRREMINLFAGALVCSAAPVYVNATGYIRSAGDIRKLKMNNSRTNIVNYKTRCSGEKYR